MWMSGIVSLWNKLYPGASLMDKMEVLFLPSGKDGMYEEAHALNLSSIYFSANVDDQKMDRILAMLDWLCSDEGKLFRRYGLDGKDYLLDEGGLVHRIETDGTAASLYAKYPSYSAIRTFPSLDSDFMNQDSTLDPFVVKLIQSYQEWKASIPISKLYTTSLTANYVIPPMPA
jgi:putative aldouronate transport system substrate-binding protein